MIEYIVKSRLAFQTEDGKIEIQEVVTPFVDLENPIDARRNAYEHSLSLLDVIGKNKYDPEKNLSEHISQYSQKKTFQIGESKFQYPTNQEGLGFNLFFILDEDFKEIKKGQEYLIIGEQEERNYLTTAENLVTEMEYFNEKGFNTEKWTTEIKYWNYESDKERDAINTTVLFTPFNFWENWNPDLAEG